MESTFLVVLLLAGFGLFKFFAQESDNEKLQEDLEHNRKEELAKMFENLKDRTDLTEFDEEQFWQLVERTSNRSKDSYRNHLGVFKDFITEFSPQKLIQLDNLILRLFRDNISYNLTAASAIIFRGGDIFQTFLLMNVMMTKGQVFFKNTSINPDFLIGKQFEDIEGRLYGDVIANVYLMKTQEFIPNYPSDDLELKISGEPWKDNELPTRFRKLWMEFT